VLRQKCKGLPGAGCSWFWVWVLPLLLLLVVLVVLVRVGGRAGCVAASACWAAQLRAPGESGKPAGSLSSVGLGRKVGAFALG